MASNERDAMIAIVVKMAMTAAVRKPTLINVSTESLAFVDKLTLRIKIIEQSTESRTIDKLFIILKFLVDDVKSFAILFINGSSLNTAPLTIFFTFDKIN